MTENGEWSAECEVALSAVEVEQLTSLAVARQSQAMGVAVRWWLFGVQVALGFLVALVGVAAGAARPEKAGPIAVAGWLACWAAMASYSYAEKRVRRLHRVKLQRAAGYDYTVTVSRRGIRVAFRTYATEMPWRGLQKVENRDDRIVLWSEQGNPLAIPARSLPPGWSMATLTERIAACIGQARASSQVAGGV